MSKKEDFKILTARQHVRARIGMYMGSSSLEQIERFVLGKWKTAYYVPALSKMIDEILDNSIDEAIRTNFKHANKIDLTVDGNTVTVTDNGRGIPQDEVFDETSSKSVLRPVAAWTKVNAGTSFDDNRVTIGTNGVGSAATNFLSIQFTGRTWQNGQVVEVFCKDGGSSTTVKTKKKSGNGTSVQFTPDFSLFDVDSLDQYDTVSLIEDRLIGLQMAFPEIKFSFNKERIKVTDLKKYAALFTEECIIERNDNLSFFFASSEDGFRSNSFVNGVNTRQGGSYVDHIVNNVADELTVLIKKKHKIEVPKSTIKNGLVFVMFARNFTNPKFDSQTKERLTNGVAEVRSHFEESGAKDYLFYAKKILNTPELIDPIIEAQLAKKLAADKRAATLAQKKLKKVKVAKHIAASSDDALLALVEGDCIEENTLVETLDGPKKIKDITTKDHVLTHKHRYKRVMSKSFSLKEGIRLNGNIYSKNHRLFVYNTQTNSFCVLEVKDIKPGVHKIVRNRIVYNGIEKSIHVVRDKKKGGILITDNVKMVFSENHEILFLTKNLEIVTKKYREIAVGDVIFL